MRCPVLVLVVVMSIVQLAFIPGEVWCQLENANQDASPIGNPGSVDTSDLSDPDIGSGEPEPSVLNTTVFPTVDRSDDHPHLVVEDAAKNPCLLATLNATMQVSYRVPEGIVHETYIALAEIQLPEDVYAHGVCGENTTRLLLTWGNNTFHVNITFTRNTYIALAEIQLPEDVYAHGVCGENTTRLLLTWGNNTFHVNITFTRNEPVTESTNATWLLTGLAVSYDLSNQDVFPGSSETDTVMIETNNLALFTTPVGYTHECSHPVKILVGTNDRGVLVNFHDVKIAAFGVTSSEFPPDVSVCTQEDQSRVQEEIIIPLIVACCLSAVVIIIVIAYVISRKIQTTRDQSQYKQMP